MSSERIPCCRFRLPCRRIPRCRSGTARHRVAGRRKRAHARVSAPRHSAGRPTGVAAAAATFRTAPCSRTSPGHDARASAGGRGTACARRRRRRSPAGAPADPSRSRRLPGGWDRELPQPRDRLLIRDSPPILVEVDEAPSPPHAAQARARAIRAPQPAAPGARGRTKARRSGPSRHTFLARPYSNRACHLCGPPTTWQRRCFDLPRSASAWRRPYWRPPVFGF
jgi:hypothetical protein